MDIILSTRNHSKVEQIKALLRGLDVTIKSLDEAEIAGEAVEDGTTLDENAFKKAMFAWEHTRGWAMADDTGLFIDALGGRPGIHAARWAGREAKTEDIMNFTLEQLRDVPTGKRTATFMTMAVVVSPDGASRIFSGSVSGTLSTEPRTTCQPDMPYSAIFIPDGQEKVWAQMSVDEENAISHRGRAFRQVRDFFSGAFL
ncbi:MAG: non-canonical purine NTP pyrophosphatase [Candidatus Sungbacteria bacterium]|nr:non-canonical purine NTP pyrophosphatase [Candidatus Sungbacteria bacterium]